jgi:hypothetical protein
MVLWRWIGGASSQSLYELTPECQEAINAGLFPSNPDYPIPPTTTLRQVVAELSLAPLTRREERCVRGALGSAIGAGTQAFELSLAPKIVEVQGVLRRIADTLSSTPGLTKEQKLWEIEPVLLGAETGFRHTYDTAIASLIINTLAREIGKERAHDRVVHFRDWTESVAEACRVAADDLGDIKGKPGRTPLYWYRDFRRVLVCIAEKNSINPTVEIDRVSGKAQGRFIELAKHFEELLPPMLRSPTDEAMAKRLQRK